MRAPQPALTPVRSSLRVQTCRIPHRKVPRGSRPSVPPPAARGLHLPARELLHHPARLVLAHVRPLARSHAATPGLQRMDLLATPEASLLRFLLPRRVVSSMDGRRAQPSRWLTRTWG